MQRLLDRHRRVDQPESQLGGLAEHLDELLRISQSRHLHQHAIDALPLDRRLDQPELVDPLVDDLDRLLDHLPDALEDRGLGHREPNQPAAHVLDVERARAGRAEETAERLRQFSQLRQPLLQVAFANAHLDRVAADDRSAGKPNARLAQDLADVVLHRLELLPAHVVGVDLEQDVRAALQVEPEHDVALRPFRPALDRALGEEIGHGEQADDERREQDRRRLPLRNIKHGSSGSTRLQGPQASTGCPWRTRKPASALVLDRLALGANARDHRAHLAHAHAVGDLDLDLVIVDHLGDLADQPAGGNDGIAAAQVLDQFLMRPSLASAAVAG